MVQLCADDTSEFPEYAMRIGDQLFGVYYGYMNSQGHPTSSNHGTLQAFLALIVPGSYSSTNGTGCTFTVNQDGSITQ
jgi:hypothetical protein